MSLQILIGRFGEFVDEASQAAPETNELEAECPAAVAQIRERFSHHLIPLYLLARSDGESVMAERLVIIRYCLDRARNAGMSVGAHEEPVLIEYLLDYQPSRAQLGPALRRLENEPKDELAALFAAAREVIDADGERRDPETRFLAQLARDLETL